MWNFFADVALNPVVELAGEYSEIQFVNCSGTLSKDKVYLTDIPAFGFASFEVGQWLAPAVKTYRIYKVNISSNRRLHIDKTTGIRNVLI